MGYCDTQSISNSRHCKHSQGIPTHKPFRLMGHPDSQGIPIHRASSPLTCEQRKYNIILSIYNHIRLVHIITLKFVIFVISTMKLTPIYYFLFSHSQKINIRHMTLSYIIHYRNTIAMLFPFVTYVSRHNKIATLHFPCKQ